LARFTRIDEAVEDEVRLADGRPTVGCVAEAVQEIEHGITATVFRVVAGGV